MEQQATKTWLSRWHLWRWAYARLYIRHKRRYGQRDQPELTAVCEVSALMGANLLSLFIVGCWVVGVHFPAYRSSKVEIIGIALVLLQFNQWRFRRKGDANELIRKFEQQRRREVRRDEVRLLWYVLGSLGAPFVLAVIALYFNIR